MAKHHSNTCGIRNNFGYCDLHAKEIILKHPCLKKDDINEIYTWLDDMTDLRKFSVGTGLIDNCITDDNGDNLYSDTRDVIKQSLAQTSDVDNQVLMNILLRLKNQKVLRNLALKCYIFSKHDDLFKTLIQTIAHLKELIYLDLSGCEFTEEQLVMLAQTIADTHIAHLVWPAPRISATLTAQLADIMVKNKSVVVVHSVPQSLEKIAQSNREWLFSFARRPALIGEKEKAIINEYAASFRLGIAFEKQSLFDLEKTVEAVLA